MLWNVIVWVGQLGRNTQGLLRQFIHSDGAAPRLLGYQPVQARVAQSTTISSSEQGIGSPTDDLGKSLFSLVFIEGSGAAPCDHAAGRVQRDVLLGSSTASGKTIPFKPTTTATAAAATITAPAAGQNLPSREAAVPGIIGTTAAFKADVSRRSGGRGRGRGRGSGRGKGRGSGRGRGRGSDGDSRLVGALEGHRLPSGVPQQQQLHRLDALPARTNINGAAAIIDGAGRLSCFPQLRALPLPTLPRQPSQSFQSGCLTGVNTLLQPRHGGEYDVGFDDVFQAYNQQMCDIARSVLSSSHTSAQADLAAPLTQLLLAASSGAAAGKQYQEAVAPGVTDTGTGSGSSTGKGTKSMKPASFTASRSYANAILESAPIKSSSPLRSSYPLQQDQQAAKGSIIPVDPPPPPPCFVRVVELRMHPLGVGGFVAVVERVQTGPGWDLPYGPDLSISASNSARQQLQQRNRSPHVQYNFPGNGGNAGFHRGLGQPHHQQLEGQEHEVSYKAMQQGSTQEAGPVRSERFVALDVLRVAAAVQLNGRTPPPVLRRIDVLSEMVSKSRAIWQV